MAIIDNRIAKVLVTKEQINEGTSKAARWIDRNYRGKNPILVAILKGSIPFFANVLMKIKIDVETDFVVFTSFKGGVKAQIEPRMVTDLINDVKGRHVLLIDDVCDSGKTVHKLMEIIKSRKAASVKLMVLADKPAQRQAPITPDFKCFTIGDEFLVGYGLDFKEFMRNIPYIGVLKKSIYTKALAEQNKPAANKKNSKKKTQLKIKKSVKKAKTSSKKKTKKVIKGKK